MSAHWGAWTDITEAQIHRLDRFWVLTGRTDVMVAKQ